MQAEAINLCDQAGCSAPATHTYTWEWGQSGTCCALHQTTLQQTSVNLGRSVTFGGLNANATPPLQREERVRLKAESLVLAEELTEAKQRGLELYRQNTQLTAQVQSLTVRGREAEAQKKDAVAARDEMDQRLGVLEAENASLSDELGRLRVLVDLPPPSDDTQPGIGHS
jgi:chromosome segregation ATPase